ncbi:glycosyltransferase [Winogradskyella sediminis]|uniref:glycosyltransferase n=1 Tax=Winogradskyella sediminis TaxID=1382466 RepID=UPI000E22474D|nr:glycosyltransferase [Winogradskyella sediminis]REG89965.1 glycosyltransferase involved in cell wall biosynthesis [Winogradskyella sediminis]
MDLHWFESKQLDRVTNYSTEIEILKAGNRRQVNVQYYCTFAKTKKYFGLKKNIQYLGVFKNKYIKAIEFRLLILYKSLLLVLNYNDNVIMVNQDLIKNVLPSVLLNKLFNKNNKFIVDIRTTPTNPETFDKDMALFHSKFKVAVKYFDGLSFITPFMERYVMQKYQSKLPTVNWSSGADINLFNAKEYTKSEINSVFKVFYHGGISVSRGNLSLIKACEDLVKKGYAIELTLVGICVDREIESYINSNNLEDWCKLLKPVPLEDIPQYIMDCDLPVLPFPNFMAWRVSSPIKLMEYLAMGKKALAPNIEAFTDVFEKDSDLIFLYDATRDNQIEEISKNIAQIIDQNLLKEHKPQNAIDFVSANYTWDKQANNLFDFCETL